MVVDDLALSRSILASILQAEGFHVVEAEHGLACLELCAQTRVDLILLDIRMPELDGYDTCSRLKADASTSEIPVIFLSALSEVEDKVKGFNVGGVDFLTKGSHRAEVMARVNTHLSLRRMKQELEDYNRWLEKRVKEKVKELAEAQFATIQALVSLAERRDQSTGEHLERTRRYCRLLAEGLQRMPAYQEVIDEEFIENLYQAAPLHDIGKVAVPDTILAKNGRLNEEEFELIKTHTVEGHATLESVARTYPRNALVNMGQEIARWHHERWDGSGYPDGLVGAAIPLSAQIMAVADVYDALTSARSYKRAWTHEEACAAIAGEAGKHFSPDIVQAFTEVEESFAAGAYGQE
ncbi:MAG: HD domain-containing phosphohydrolase [Vulcanimicrobiota bacterium]